MLIAVGATNKRSAARASVPDSTTSQKQRIWVNFIFSEYKSKK